MNRILITVLLTAVFAGCRVLSFEELAVSFNPERSNQILLEDEEISMSFEKPVKQDIQADLLLVLEGRPLPCDSAWQENRLILTPLDPMLPGKRYHLRFNGTVRYLSGEQFAYQKEIPFYYKTGETGPEVTDFSPKDKSVVGVGQEISIRFNKPVNKQVFERLFYLSPGGPVEFQWKQDNQSVEIRPTENWENLTPYTWHIPQELTDSEGIVAPYLFSRSFRTGIDSASPGEPKFLPGKWQNSEYKPLGTPGGQGLALDQLAKDDVIIIDFEEAVDFLSIQDNFSTEPSISHTLLQITNSRFVCAFNRIPKPESRHRIILDKGISDLSGNKTQGEFSCDFSFGGIPTLELTRLRVYTLNPDDSLPTGEVDLSPSDWSTLGPVSILPGRVLPEIGSFIVQLYFNLPAHSLAEQGRVFRAVSLRSTLPVDGPSPELIRHQWENSLGSSHLSLEYRLPDPYTDPGADPLPWAAQISRYYELALQDSANGAYLDSGSALTESILITLVDEEE